MLVAVATATGVLVAVVATNGVLVAAGTGVLVGVAVASVDVLLINTLNLAFNGIALKSWLKIAQRVPS